MYMWGLWEPVECQDETPVNIQGIACLRDMENISLSIYISLSLSMCVSVRMDNIFHCRAGRYDFTVQFKVGSLGQGFLSGLAKQVEIDMLAFHDLSPRSSLLTHLTSEIKDSLGRKGSSIILA
jgi:hypothetical protein